MENYDLLPNEVLLYKGKAHYRFKGESKFRSCQVLLTNFSIVLQAEEKKWFSVQARTWMEEIPVEDIKCFNGEYQVVQKEGKVILYLIGREAEIRFSYEEARKFVNELMTLLTGQTMFQRGAAKAARILTGTIGGFMDEILTGTSAAVSGFSRNSAKTPDESMNMDEKVDHLKKLKELLDAGILSPEEFEQKKKEILDL